jgi:hypothetical protein
MNHDRGSVRGSGADLPSVRNTDAIGLDIAHGFNPRPDLEFDF